MRTLFGRGRLARLAPSPPPSRQAPDPEQADARPTYVGVAAARPADMASAAIGTMARPVDLKRGGSGPRGGRQEPARPADTDAVAEFIRLHRRECPEAGEVGPRLREIRREVELTGTYQHTSAELVFGARVAWRNSCRCIGRLYWQSLQVRDRRDVSMAADIAAECAVHLRRATNGGRIRPTITVFAPDTPGRPGPRIWNEQIVRYAGYQRPDGTVHGD